ncbi:fructosamine kinase family protein [Tomitella fengzijianii]|uniref:Phosphotransferase n=1 Tax=Tomitella fengzijianii TaxID=2597660 RepID=A0A516X6M9_9ACTN|nr:fructosamine kinase family protein [Tomitella fengzijianii]QDQ98716.1 phosphotransferase [Tomitella fengzijianii]
MGVPGEFTKSDPHAPPGFFATEAAGLRWLAESGGARIVGVREESEHGMMLERVDETAPRRDAAWAMGRGLARTHAAGADAFGALPPGAKQYFFGPMCHPLALPHAPSPHFGEFYAAARVEPVALWCRGKGAIDGAMSDGVERVCADLRAGRWDLGADGRPVRPARIHGDLWAGNVLWDDGGAVLIDPAACGGHPEADLAMLSLFGAPHLESIVDGYANAAPLPGDWTDRIGLHQLFPLLVHALLFGGGYAASARAAVAALID